MAKMFKVAPIILILLGIMITSENYHLLIGDYIFYISIWVFWLFILISSLILYGIGYIISELDKNKR